jgi:hypothetical protein
LDQRRRFTNTPISFGASDVEQIYCRNPLSVISAEDTIGPIFQGSCWERVEDRPGKWGWHCSSKEVKEAAHQSAISSRSISFRMSFSSALPRLLISYLETYENAGKAQVFVQFPSEANFSFHNQSEIFGSTVTCGFFDTFKRESHYSQETSKLFWSSTTSGSARLVHESAFRGRDKCRFPPLSESRSHQGMNREGLVTIMFSSEIPARIQRKGDRVKLVSLTSC